MWQILQHDVPDDFVIATGESHSIREFVEYAFEEIGIVIQWKGQGKSEKGYNTGNGNVVVEVDPRYFRPAEVDHLLGDPSKAREVLKWEASTKMPDLVKMMVDSDLVLAQKDAYLVKGGYSIKNFDE